MLDNSVTALRCSDCSTNWPADERNYKPCPECGGEVWAMSKDSAIDAAEAMSRKSHAEFERYCAKRDALKQHELDQLEKSLTS